MSEAVVQFARQETGDWLKNAIEREAERLRGERDALMRQVAPIAERLAQLDAAMAALADKPIVRKVVASRASGNTGLTDAIRTVLNEAAVPLRTSDVRGALHQQGWDWRRTTFTSQALSVLHRNGKIRRDGDKWMKVA